MHVVTVVILFAAGVVVPKLGNAQQDSLRGTNPTTADSIAAIAAWRISDTGRMTPGYRDLSRYDTPGMCLVAMQGVLDVTWRRVEVDTIARFTPGDTVPTAVRDIGRACLANMTPERVDSADLYDLMRAALMVGDIALARNTVIYHASKVTRSVEERGGVFVDAIEFALQSGGELRRQSKFHPTQQDWAESMFSLLMALGPDAQNSQSKAFELRRRDAYVRFDTAAIIRLGVEIDAFVRGLITVGRLPDSIQLRRIFIDSMAIVRYQRDPNFAQMVRRLGDRYVALSSGNDTLRMFAEGIVEDELRLGKYYGTPAPPSLTMFRHYPADAPTGPVPGRVTIVGFIDKLGGGFMEPYLATFRRLHEKYHARGLDILLIARTHGFAWGSPPLDSAQEAKLIGWYYRDHLKLPFTIFVAPDQVGRLSDGRLQRIMSKSIPTIGPIREWRPWWGYIVARDGTIARQITGTQSVHRIEAELDAYIRRELALPTTASSTQ